MPARLAPEAVARIKELQAQGKSSRVIAQETGIGKSSVARYMTIQEKPVEGAAPDISTPQIDMLNDNAARAFLGEIGITAPATTLRNEIVPASSPLKNNPKVLLLAQKLLGQPRVPERLIANTVLVPPPQPPSITAPEPVVKPPDAAQMISRIQMNVENFGPLLKNIVKPDTETFLQSLYVKDDEELKILLKVIERARLTGNMANQFKHVFWMTTGAVEVGAPFIGIKAEGLTQALRQQEEEVALILKEMALERADSFEQAQRPEVRLAFLVSTTLLSVDSINRIKAQRQGRPKAEEPPEQKYKDL